MRNLSFYPGNAFDFYKEVVASKRNSTADPVYRTRLTALEGVIQPLFHSYDQRFTVNQLERLNASVLSGQQRADLLKLYSYQNSVLQRLKVQLTTIDFNRVINTCQCCTIGEVSSFDHLVPKDEFPEFSANPKNLFPSCHKCNGYKNIAWRNGTARVFLNLFLDALPTQQYLFAEINITADGTVDVTFELRNPHHIHDDTFTLIQSHFTNLHLFDRFQENSDSVIIPVLNAIKMGRATLSIAALVEQIHLNSRANMNFFGANYWKSIIEIALADNADFMNFEYTNP